MTGLHRKLGLAFAFALLTAPAFSLAPRDEVSDLFNQGVELLRRGHDDEALQAFKQVLAKNPTHDQAYELWKNIDADTWLDIMSKGGEFELVAKRLQRLGTLGRAERKNDAEAIKDLLGKIRSDDAKARREAVRRLASEHGEFAVPMMLPTLADTGAEDRRVLYMTTLSQMDSDVVPPLIEALASEDAFLRRNVALTLGYIGDRRAGGMLAVLAASDPDPSVQAAAKDALGRVKASGNPLRDFLEAGAGYQMRRDSVLAAHEYSTVVWNWTDKGLVAKPVPRDVYGDEMSRKSYYRALAVDPGSLEARAGLARACASEMSSIELMTAAGQDATALQGDSQGCAVALNLAGADALDLALSNAVRDGDSNSGIGLVRALAQLPNAPTAGLNQALNSQDGALRAESALAIAHTAMNGRNTAGPDVVNALGDAAGRDIARMAFVIDSDASRCSSVNTGLKALGVSSVCWDNGAKGTAMLHRVPGVDVILVADKLSDLTTDQVIDDIRADSRYEKTPVFVLSAAPEKAAELYGSTTQGVIGNPADLSAVGAALGAVTGDRARADKLAAQAAMALAHLSMSGTNVSSALTGLTSTLATRPDEVTIPAMFAIGAAGDGTHVAALMAVVSDEKRSEAARAAAANAAAAIFGRGAQASAEGLAALSAVLKSDAPMSVKTAVAGAVGNLRLDPEVRAELLRTARMAKTKPTE